MWLLSDAVTATAYIIQYRRKQYRMRDFLQEFKEDVFGQDHGDT